MSRRILPPDPADMWRSLSERVERLERQKFPEPAPQPIVSGGGGSCSHIWGGLVSPAYGWESQFGSWVGRFGLEIDVPAVGQVQVSGSVNFDTFPGFDLVTLNPWMDGYAGMNPAVNVAPGGSGTITYTFLADPGPLLHGYAVMLTPNSVAAPPEWQELPVNVIWSECGFGESARGSF